MLVSDNAATATGRPSVYAALANEGYARFAGR